MPVRVKKTRQNNKLGPGSEPGSRRHKTDKRSATGLSKAALRWYIPLAAQGLVPRVGLLRKPPDGINRRSGVGGTSRHRFFDEAAQRLIAGWSSPVARQAHNLKVTGSNPVPATKLLSF